MLKYVIKRLILLIPVLFGITLLVFIVLNLSPSDPVLIALGNGEFTVADYEAKKAAMGLNEPLLVRYINYIKDLFRGDLGTSWFQGFDVASEFGHRLPYSLKIGVFANFISILIGIPFGIIAGIRHNKSMDFIVTFVALILAAAPNFWLGMMGQIYLSVKLGLLPVSGIGSFWHYILPAAVAASNMTANNMRITRTWLVDVINSDYVRTARAKGAHEFTVVVKHALRNALLPIITTLGMNFATILGSVMIVETVFAVPGASLFLINAVKTGDIPIVMGCIVIVALFVGVVNLLIDLIYALVDPRVKYS
jgi:peptide/nickel transport system permease protein